ncbi:MAG: hypothetical protein ACYC9O_08790 [Candidatus Latescibacterota bacterium]
MPGDIERSHFIANRHIQDTIMESCKLCREDLEYPNEKESGLCEGCALAVESDTFEQFRIIRKCEFIINSPAKHRVRLYNCLLLIQKAKWLQKYEMMGIQTISPPPLDWIDRYHEKYDEIVLERIFEEVNDSLSQAEQSYTAFALDTHINSVLQKIDEGKKLFLNKTRCDTLNSRVMSYLYSNLLTLTL